MTMIISAHLGDCILIASDKRSMHCDLETGNMRLATNDEQKINLIWLNRVRKIEYIKGVNNFQILWRTK